MKAAVISAKDSIHLQQAPIPEIGDGEALIRLRYCGICGSDLHGLAVPPGQYMKPGIVYGHEFCGTIVKMGQAVQGFALNDRVAVNPRVR